MAKRKGDIFGSILNSMDKKSRSIDEARKADTSLARVMGDKQSSSSGHRGPQLPTHSSQGPDSAIATFLEDMRDTIETQGYGAIVEVELRLGKITSSASGHRFAPSVPGDACVVLQEHDMRSHGAKFVPGVRKEDYQQFFQKAMRLTTSDAFARQEEQQNVSTFPGSKRVVEEINLNTGHTEAPYQQVKQRLGTIDIFLPHCDYDCRVAVSLEFPATGVSLESLPAPEHRRGKKRTSAVGRDIRLDMTEVSDNGVLHAYEVELELQNTLVKEWLKLPQGQSVKGALDSAGILWGTVSKTFMKEASQAYKQSWDAVDPTNELRHAYQRHFDNPQKFPGTMPVGFTRSHIATVRDRDYFCSEKTDGVRYFLVVANTRIALVDRSNLPFAAPGLEALAWIFPDGTVLDGEYVFHQKEGRYIFMAFDVVAVGPLHADACVKKTFRERLEVLAHFFSEEGPYLQGLRSHGFHTAAVLSVLKKRWTNVKEIRNLFRSIKSVMITKSKERVRVYSDGKREHFTDGVVFCPGYAPYVSFSHTEYLKWKWSDLITIDFLAEMREGGAVRYSCTGPGNKMIELDNIVMVDPKDTSRIAALVQRNPSGSAILEFAFNADVGLWQFKLERPDKDTPNYIRTVLGSLINMAEAISEEELQCRLLMRNSEDAWNDCMKQKRKDALNELLHRK
ncbi:Aste57867_1514 [Aphanomyces stellatus]|uniref:mRNA 5'-phosphatase n=1 Tax=Aphanomyces stellatus TaxID=120398 RepID=A0A485K6F8_9STRA|nr:hypothetical protein As57867_001513 [Aphanomyces stellatus]VFT78730.1 Aste57867_1514 [Aphanomyces stellatus]